MQAGMKIYFVICVAITAIGTVHSRSLVQGYNYPMIETSDEDLFLQESGPAPNPNYNKVLGRRQRVLIDEEVEIEAGTGDLISHGNNVSLQLLYSKRDWLSCYPGGGNQCLRAQCPGLYLNDTKVENCWGEVFQIYRRNGPGQVLVGDVVAFHYFHQIGYWFSLYECNGRALPCPGIPTVANGMSSSSAWTSCWGEVFVIYAKDKAIGDVVTSNDNVFLYHPGYDQYVSFVGSNPTCAPCPGAVRPPGFDKYDGCWGENFEIWQGSKPLIPTLPPPTPSAPPSLPTRPPSLPTRPPSFPCSRNKLHSSEFCA